MRSFIDKWVTLSTLVGALIAVAAVQQVNIHNLHSKLHTTDTITRNVAWGLAANRECLSNEAYYVDGYNATMYAQCMDDYGTRPADAR